MCDSYQHVGARRRQSIDSDAPADETAGTAGAPARDERPADERACIRLAGALGRQMGIESEPEVAARRNLPQHVVHTGLDLGDLEIARTDLVRRGDAGHAGEHEQSRESRGHRLHSAALVGRRGLVAAAWRRSSSPSSPSMRTSYLSSRPR